MLEEVQEGLDDLEVRMELVVYKEDSANRVEALVTRKVSALVFAPPAQEGDINPNGAIKYLGKLNSHPSGRPGAG